MLEGLAGYIARPIKRPKRSRRSQRPKPSILPKLPKVPIPTEGVALLEELRDLTFSEDRSEALARAEQCLQRVRNLKMPIDFRTRVEAHQLLVELETGGTVAESLHQAKIPSQAILHLHEALGYCGQPVWGTHLARQYFPRWPTHAALRHWAAVIESTRSDAPHFRDHLSDDLQVLRTEGATTTVLVFTTLGQTLGVPLNVAYRCWLSDLKANFVFLRDFQNCVYVGGIQSVGNHEATCARLQGIIDELKSDRLVTIGLSAGNFGALFYGALLNAHQIVALAGPTSLDIGLQYPHKQSFQKVRDRHLAGEVPWPDIRQMLLDKPNIPVRCFYSEGHHVDARQARNLMGLPNVEIIGIPDSKEHYTLGILHEQGRLVDIFRSAIEGESGAQG